MFDDIGQYLPIDFSPYNISPNARNDLQIPAIRLEPKISVCLDVLAEQAGCSIWRMSGSGATCFGLFETAELAQKAAINIRKSYPAWWVQQVLLGDAS